MYISINAQLLCDPRTHLHVGLLPERQLLQTHWRHKETPTGWYSIPASVLPGPKWPHFLQWRQISLGWRCPAARARSLGAARPFLAITLRVKVQKQRTPEVKRCAKFPQLGALGPLQLALLHARTSPRARGRHGHVLRARATRRAPSQPRSEGWRRDVAPRGRVYHRAACVGVRHRGLIPTPTAAPLPLSPFPGPCVVSSRGSVPLGPTHAVPEAEAGRAPWNLELDPVTRPRPSGRGSGLCGRRSAAVRANLRLFVEEVRWGNSVLFRNTSSGCGAKSASRALAGCSDTGRSEAYGRRLEGSGIALQSVTEPPVPAQPAESPLISLSLCSVALRWESCSHLLIREFVLLKFPWFLRGSEFSLATGKKYF